MNYVTIIFLLVHSLYLCSFVLSLENFTTDSLDALVQDSALQTLVRGRPRTGSLYQALLPANLSGMEASVVRLRSRRLWNIGANFSKFQIPPRTETMPHVKRVAIVYQDLGNWSSQYYSIPGYSMLTSVVGFMVFNASDARVEIETVQKVSLSTKGKPIVIQFNDSVIPDGIISEAKCAAFYSNGTFLLSKLDRLNMCYSQHPGHFSIMVPLERKGRNQRKWRLWIVGFVLGCGALALAGYIGVLTMKLSRTKKIQVMERQADEDLVLQTVWVGISKMPSATVTRTQPTLENGGFSFP